MESTRGGADEAAVRAVEAAYDAAWQEGDIDALLRCLAEDAVLVNPHGETARGHAEIRRELEAVLSGPARGSKHTSVLIRVEFLTADVAIVDGHAWIEGAGQEESAASLTHRFTDILVRKNGMWVIAHIRACAATSLPRSAPR